MKLHLGCGRKKIKGFVNCDVLEGVSPDRVVNLEEKLPFKDNSVDEIYSRHTFEHVQNFMQLMEELYRICKPNAKLKIIVPYFSHPGAFQDPTHKRFFTLRTFDYFDNEKPYSYYSNVRFRTTEKRLVFFVLRPKLGAFFDFVINKNKKIYERFFAGIFPAEELIIKMEVLK